MPRPSAQDAQPRPEAGPASPTSGLRCHPAGGNAALHKYGICAAGGRRREGERAGVGQRRPHPTSPAGPRGTALPRKAGKESENRFLFFHRVPSIYRPGRSGSFHPGHPERTGPRASLRPTWGISRLGRPACERRLEAGLGPEPGRGTGPELRDRKGAQPSGQMPGPGAARAGSMQININ